MRWSVMIAAVVVLAGATGFILWWQGEETETRKGTSGAEAVVPRRTDAGAARETAPPAPTAEVPPAAAGVDPAVEPEPDAPAGAEPGRETEAPPEPAPERTPEQAPRSGAGPEPATEAKEKQAAPPAPPPLHAGPAVYIGADACGKCHADAERTWKRMRHAAAWEGLPAAYRGPDAKDHKGRACVSCHVTGYGDRARKGFVDAAASGHLLGVQCEACHGPGSRHRAAAERVAADPARDARTFRPGEDTFIVRKPTGCAECHDPHTDWSRYKAAR